MLRENRKEVKMGMRRRTSDPLHEHHIRLAQFCQRIIERVLPLEELESFFQSSLAGHYRYGYCWGDVRGTSCQRYIAREEDGMSRMTLTFNVTSSTEGPTVSHSEYDFTLGVFLPLLDLVRQGPYDGRIERVERFGTVEFVGPGRALRFEEDRGRLSNASSTE
jgi:hypothetical protein